MVRTLFLTSFLALIFAMPARAGEFTCTVSHSIRLSEYLAHPSSYIGQCLQLRGDVRGVPKLGVTLSNGSPGGLTLYFDGDEPDELDKRTVSMTVTGRILRCDDIGKNAEETARLANAREAATPRPAGQPEIVYLGMVFGVCHYRDDIPAMLVTSYSVIAEKPL